MEGGAGPNQWRTDIDACDALREVRGQGLMDAVREVFRSLANRLKKLAIASALEVKTTARLRASNEER